MLGRHHFRTFFDNDTVYIVMEYIDGVTLQNWINCLGKVGFIRCLELLKPIMYCLEAVHKMGIIHRDICPENIIITEELKCKIIDFGTAVDLSRDNSRKILEATYRRGYSPPEQYEYGRLIDYSSDIYSVMAIVYYCLTGHTPPDALGRIHNDIFLKDRVAGISQKAEKILKMGMDLESKNRYKAMELLISEIWKVVRD